MEEYKVLVHQYAGEVQEFSLKYKRISFLRLGVVVTFLVLVYSGFKWEYYSLFSGALILFCLFVFLLIKHQRVSREKLLAETLQKINKEEIDFLQGKISFEDGSDFIDPHHLYSYDLDIFGPHSLFQYLNRTSTYRGSELLADSLIHQNSKEEILLNQAAVEELSKALTLRQKISALGLINRDDQEHYQFLINWTKKNDHLNQFVKLAIYILPGILILLILIFAFSHAMPWLNAATVVFIANLILLGNNSKKVKAELSGLDKLDGVIKHYGLMLHELEVANFQTDKLRDLKKKITLEADSAGSQLKILANLLNQLDSIFNGMAVMLFSGTFCYHLHLLEKIYKWKKRYGDLVENWLEVIAHFEVLSSLGNLKYNNPGFVYPEISDQAELSIKDLGHPLVPEKVRVNNDISFDSHRFVILTGSNMSGKSTFLRSLGVNVVLAGAGSSICASQAKIYPFIVMVSMRVADSLAENESYFYAEVKRLKQITDQLDRGHCLVLLDEILRGTNSDDKRNGTLEVIRRMVREGAFGVIATHDLEVCKETDLHPDALCNKCFEVEIRNDELFFDYKLGEGICVNQSATFLMKKTGII